MIDESWPWYWLLFFFAMAASTAWWCATEALWRWRSVVTRRDVGTVVLLAAVAMIFAGRAVWIGTLS